MKACNQDKIWEDIIYLFQPKNISKTLVKPELNMYLIEFEL